MFRLSVRIVTLRLDVPLRRLTLIFYFLFSFNYLSSSVSMLPSVILASLSATSFCKVVVSVRSPTGIPVVRSTTSSAPHGNTTVCSPYAHSCWWNPHLLQKPQMSCLSSYRNFKFPMPSVTPNSVMGN
ncbi:uncharacterized protein CLUP02_16347 [Colletotrichum lupini]|uniref:Uncharacterized protein n=1 Tax=Colletotrichum lupini TaxID=145971 RepID=A0A9Q8WQ29_9PEZI|nr:uncharacterized protein CLUP02_16347 [Colletotrichum lupini]KAK1713496.1 hypothetical protein BDP67DRAFT_39938 [Colletotrichum lupini]UQC90815.1 hypothetical protein CLUP02_16347 [Colletotrichum lupini]